MPSAVNKLKDKLEDDVLDLSLMQLDEVPVEEIGMLKKGTTVDLSNNSLSRLPDTFPTLTHIVKLDLSKNQLQELPEYFGLLKNLKHLDLYSNQIQRLPVSFCQLKSLRWLDLKNNPLVPALSQAAGPCQNTADCAMCAKNVVALMMHMQLQLDQEREKMFLHQQKVEQKRALEQQQVRNERKAAKAKSRPKPKTNMNIDSPTPVEPCPVESPRVELPRPKTQKHKGGLFWPFFMFAMTLAAAALGAVISLLWIYTDGRLDQHSIERAVPVILSDIDRWIKKMQVALAPYIRELDIKATKAAHLINESVGPYFCCWKRSAFELYNKLVEWAKPHLHYLARALRDGYKVALENFKIYFPRFVDFLYLKLSEIAALIQATVNALF